MGPGAAAILTAAAALAITLPIGRFAMPLGQRLGLLDWPDTDGGRKRHAAVTPLVGGLGLALASLATIALTLALLPAAPWLVQHLAWLGGVVAAMYLIGFADDRFALGPAIRLTLTIATLGLALVFAPDFTLGWVRFAGQPQLWLLGAWGDAFALLCLVGLLNAVNMADGKNGIILSLALIWSAVLAVHLPPPLWPVLAGVAAALAVLLACNLRGILFMGDGGSYVLSALFGLLAIYAYNNDFEVMRADDVATMFAIPVFDTIRLMSVRAARRRSPFEGDRDHLHHHLHSRYGWPRGLYAYVALVALPNLGAVLCPGTGLVWLAVSLLLYGATLWATRWRSLPTRSA